MSEQVARDTLFLVIFSLLMAGIFLVLSTPSHSDMANWPRAFANVIVHEGARYTNDPADPGGPTKWGITLQDVKMYRDRHATAADVKVLTKEDARDIYRVHYADPIQFDRLPRGVDYVVFDYAVNAGIGRSVGDFSRVLKVPYTARMTDEMVTAALLLDPHKLIQALDDRRMAFQMGLRAGLNKFKRGWRIRINSVNTIAHDMAGGQQNRSFFTFDDLVPRIGPGKAYEGNDGTI